MGKASKRKARRAAPQAATPPEGAAVQSDWTPISGSGDDTGEVARYRFAAETEQRASERISERELGRVSAALRPPGASNWVPVQLLDFTSIGFGVHFRNDQGIEAALDPMLGRLSPSAGGAGLGMAERASNVSPVRSGDEVEFRIRIGAHEEFTVWCQVANVARWREGSKIGLRRLDLAFPQPVELERRESMRLTLTPALSLKARVRHPFLYGHWSALTVSDLNREMGISFRSDDPSILLFEGMELTVYFELSAFRREPMKARVAWVNADSSDSVRFGVACESIDFRLHNALCDFLLFSQLWTPARLRQAGFQGKQVKGHLRFGTVKTMDEYADVLYLRRDAYVGVGKRPTGTRPEKMSSPLDGRSRILTARHHGNLVGTLTFTFPSSEEMQLDTQTGFPGCKYPVPLPPKANIIEVSRLCIDESYRGTDVLVGMFEYGIKHFLLSDRHWLLTSSTEELLPLYQRIGFTKLKAAYKHPLLNQQLHYLIIAHRSAFLWGFGMDVLTWNSVFGDLVTHLLKRRLIQVPGWVRFIVGAKLMLRPLARYLSDAKARRAFAKHFDALRSMRGRPANASRGAEAHAKPDPSEAAPVGGSLFAEMEVDVPEAEGRHGRKSGTAGGEAGNPA